MATRPSRKTTKPKPRPRFQWATSQRVGGVSEIAVLAPIRKGIVPGERRTYEERLRASIANLAKRHQQGIPTDLDKVSTIHFGRMIVIRPEQYLLLSDIDSIEYDEYDEEGNEDARTDGQPQRHGPLSRVPRPLDDFIEIAPLPPESQSSRTPSRKPELRSWLLTLVEFDGELKSYMREIAHFMGREFDRIFENCELYPSSANFDEFWIWIRTFQIRTDLFYAPYRDLSVVRIRQLEAFKRRFDAFVARVRSPTGPTVRSMDEMFDEFLRENQQYAAGFPNPGGTYASDDER
ncbi:MAG TPA: hypothetical protein VFZ91_01680 [Allosphingosinicella sp.]